MFDLGGMDVILRVAWLALLGDIKVNWRTLTEFRSSGATSAGLGKPIIIQDPGLSLGTKEGKRNRSCYYFVGYRSTRDWGK